MTKARDIANLVDSNGDVVTGALDNVPASDNASALTTGTLPDGRFPATLPAISGANLTGVAPTKATVEALNIDLPAANLTGTVATARLGTGSASNGNFLRGDGSWQVAGSTNASDLTSGTLNSARLPSGSVLQIVSTQNNSLNSTTNGNVDGYADIGLNVNITPKSSNSKFLVTVTVGLGTVTGGNSWGLTLFRDSSKSSLNGWNDGSRKGTFLRGVDHAGSTGNDSNHGIGAMNHGVDNTSGTAGTQITFKAGGVAEGGTMYINRNESNANNSNIYTARGSSTISVMEIEK